MRGLRKLDRIEGHILLSRVFREPIEGEGAARVCIPNMFFSTGRWQTKAASSHSFLIGVAVGVAFNLALLGLNVVVIHEVDGNLSLCSLFPALTLLLLLLHQTLLTFLSLLGGFGLGLNSLLVNKSIVELSRVHSMVISQKVMDKVTSADKVLFAGLNFLQFSAGHFLGGLHTLEGGGDILIVI